MIYIKCTHIYKYVRYYAYFNVFFSMIFKTQKRFATFYTHTEHTHHTYEVVLFYFFTPASFLFLFFQHHIDISIYFQYVLYCVNKNIFQ